jgi:hypothetical protein
MAGRRKRSRIYWRQRGGARRAYADFRDFADVGGGREALVPKGGTVATTDPVLADALVGKRLEEFQERRRNKNILGRERQATLKDYAAHHLLQKARAGCVTDGWLAAGCSTTSSTGCGRVSTPRSQLPPGRDVTDPTDGGEA